MNNFFKLSGRYFLLIIYTVVFFYTQSLFAQISGTKTIPGDYATIAAAIADLNTQGVGTGGVTFNVDAGHTETFATDVTGVITATGTAANQIIFQKSGAGANPLITAGLGTIASSTTLTAHGDGIIIIVGGDYITFDGIDLQDNPAAVGNEKTEVGYFLKKASGTDAPKNVTIKNCSITLDKTTIYSWGIYVSNFDATGTGITVTSTDGRSENIKIFNNTISNVYGGIQLRGFLDSAPYDFYDHNIEVGVDGANSITNYGGGGSTAYGFYAIYQDDLKVANNIINSGAGTTTTLYGVFTSTGTNSSADFYNNTITIQGGGTTSTIYAFNNGLGASGTDNTVNIYNNIIEDCTYPTATSGVLYCLYQSTSPFNVNIYGNIVRNNIKSGTSGSMYPLYNINTGANGFANIYDNQIYGNTNNGSGLIYCLYTNEAATSTKMVYNNTIYNNAGGGDVIGIFSATGVLAHIYGNNIYDLTSNTTGTASPYSTGIQVSTGTNIYVYNNFISDLKAPTSGAVDAVRGIGLTSATTNATRGVYFNTIFLNATSSGTNFGSSGIYHINSTTATSSTLDMRNNIVVNQSTPNGTGKTVAFRRSASNVNLNNYSEISNNNSFYSGTPGASNVIFFDGTNFDETIDNFKLRVDPRETVSFTEDVKFVNSTTAPFNLHVDTTVPTQTESGGQTISTPIAITDDFDGDLRNATTPDVGADEFDGIGQDLTPALIVLTPLQNSGSLANRTLVVTVTDASGVPTTHPGWPHLYWRINTGSWSAATPSSVVGDDYTFNFGAGVIAGDKVEYYVVAQDLAGTPNVGANPSAGAGGFTTNPPAASTPPDVPFNYEITESALSGNYTIGSTAFRNMTGKDITFERVVNIVIKEVWVENPVTEESETQTESSGSFQLIEVEEVSWIPMENGILYTGDLYVKRNENPQLNFPAGIEGIYATVTAAVTDLNVRGVSGATTFLLEDATYLTETLPITININNEFMPTAVNNVTFKPNTGVTSLISGSTATGDAVFKLNGPGANYIVFDGSNSGSTTRNLTVENTSTSTNTTVFWVSSLGDGMGASNITLKNMIIKAGSNTVTSTFGIYGAGTTVTTTGTGASNNNLTIQNNEIIKAYRAVFVRGLATARTEGLVITENIIGSALADDYVTFRGIDITNATEPVISNNTIFNIIISTTLTIAAIDFGTNVTDALVSRNYIHTVQSTTGGALGINISSSSGTAGITIVNNFIAGMTGTGSTTAGSTISNPFGIRITGGSGHKVYFNSINLFGAFGGTGNYISSPLVVTSNLATDLDIRNNIFANSMTGDGTTKAYSIYGASGLTYGTINNNNYFPSGPNGVLGFLGSDITTLTALKVATGQDANSVRTNPLFTSDLDLHINAGLTPTSLESGGAFTTGFTIDFDGDVRPGPAGSVNGGATAPDIGADEFDGVPAVPMVYVSSTVTQNNTGLVLANSTNNEIIGIQVVTTGESDPLVLDSLDFTTVGTTNLSDITNAKVWYTGSSSSFATTVQFGSTLAVPTADFTITGSQALVQGTNYFWLTFDLPVTATSGNTIDAQCTTIVISSDPFTPTVTDPAGSRTILGTLSGSYDVGSGQDFNTITDAVTALSVVGVSSAVTFNLTDSDYSTGETFPLTINEVTGASAVNTITFKPAVGVTASINGTSSTAILKLNGADYVTFDGSNSGGTDRSLTVQNNSTATSTAVIWVASLGTGAGAENNTLKNLNVIGGSRTVSSFFGIYVGGTSISTSGTGAHNNNLTILNNSIQKAYYGIYARGVATTGVNTGLNISNNSIGSEIEDNYIGKYGMEIREADGALISGNTIFNIIGTSTNPTGMWIQTGFVNSSISANHIYEMTYTGTSGYGGKGIDINTGNAASNVTIVNNVIHDIKGDGWSTLTGDAIVGIKIYSTTAQGGFNIYYNSINLSGNSDRSATATLSAGLYIHSNVSALDIRDNVFSNSIVNNLNAGAKAFAIYTAGTNTAFTSINYNDYYASGVQGVLGFLTADITTITDWRTASGQDVNSFVSDPTFNSNINLIPLPGSPLVAAGTPIGGVTTDFLGVLRNGTTPTVGAYENAADAVGPVIDYTTLVNTNSLANRVLSDVTITDISGVDVTTNKPRIYYKKSTDADVFGGNTSTDNGWKWTETSQTASPFQFTIDYSKLIGGAVVQDDIVQYFVVAQDLAAVPNVSANPSAGFSGTSVSNITSAPATPNSYKLVGAPMAGDYTVGLAAFNLANNKNLVQETRSRKVVIKVPVEETIIANSKSTGSSISNVEKSLNEEIEDVDTQISSSTDLSIVETAPVEPVYETIIRYETVEVDEEYTVLLEDGELFEWKTYYERMSDGFVEGIYPTIAAAVADLLERGVNAPVRFLLVDATYSETYPIVLSEFVGASSSNTVTFKPQTGVSPVISATSPSVAMFHIDRGDYYIFDGSNTSGGTSRDLTLSNSSTTIPIFRIENGATNNTLKNLVINGQVTSTVNGLIALLSTTTGTGNTNNSFVNNSFNDVSGSRAANYIYSSGSAISPNSNTTITGNEFKNFTSAGVRGATGSGGDWIISNNHLFNVLSASTALSPITLTPGITSGGNNNISGNFIGGSAPNAAGDPLVVTSASSFAGITVSSDSLNASVVNNNILKNISLQNTGSHTFNGINITGGLVNITDNIVGDNTSPNNILVAGSSSTMGINYTLPAGLITGPAVISGNLVANLTGSGTGTSVAVRGIHTVCTLRVDILSNIVHSLSSSGAMAALTGNNQTAVGINAWQQTYLGSIIEGNTIYNINAVNTGAVSTHAVGIFTSNLDGSISKNRIYNITNQSTGTTATAPPTVAGIFVRFTSGGAISNNMISLGNDFMNDVQVNGIFNPANATTGTPFLFILYNSIRISGTVTSGSHNSFSFLRGDNNNTAVITHVGLRNNIFDNQRTGGTGKHYTLGNQVISAGWELESSDYNLLNSFDMNTVGLWGSSDNTFADWKISSGGDGNSYSDEFVNYVNIATADLHLDMGTTVTVLESGGFVIPEINFDFDGDVRPGPAGSVNGGATAPDIGADEFDGVPAAVATFQLTVDIEGGWNMVSTPGLHPVDQNVNTWWVDRNPAANVFKFDGGYQSVTNTTPGEGYWMLHVGNRTYNTGDEWPAGGILIVPNVPLNGNTGWNLIGGYHLTVATSGITTDPSGLQQGSVFGYTASGGYSVAANLVPGYAYWLLLSGPGQIIIPSSLAKAPAVVTELTKEEWGRIVITDNSGKRYILYGVSGEVNLNNYLLPPAPPAGMFDVRYGSGRYAEDVTAAEQMIEMSGIEYPVTVRVENMSIRVQDETGKIVNAVVKSGEEVVISNPMVGKLKVTSNIIPDVYALEQNYPNPFNPSTTIEFSIPEDVENVKLTIYDALGQKVAELVNGKLEAGRYSYQWDAGKVASGLYIYQLQTDKFVSTKKMMMLK